MNTFEMMKEYGHENIAYFNNEKAGLKCFIAIHSSALGPALGGCRLFPYQSEEAALFDVLRLSRGMSLKNAGAGLPLGGAKAVIIADPSQKTDAMFEAFGEAVESFGGKYIAAEDVNTDTHDADIMCRTSNHIVGLAHISGDPSPITAIGVMNGLRATAKFLNGSDSLDGMTVALQGLGKVGWNLARLLHEAGAKLIVCNRSNKERLKEAQELYGAKIVSADEIYDQECDIFAPCALGASVNYDTVPRFKCRAIAGAANNVLLDNECGLALKKRGIAYAPDYIINAGGVTNCGQEAFTEYSRENVINQISGIYDKIYNILDESSKTGEPEGLIADRFAQGIIDSAK